MAGTTIATSGTVGRKLTSTTQNPVLVTSSGTIVSAGTYAIYDAVTSGTVTNFGLLQGATGVAIGNSDNVVNDGTILGTVGAGVVSSNGGSVGNGSTAQTGRSIQGVTFGVYLGHAQNGYGAVSNFGSIGASGTAGVGVDIGLSGTVINGSTGSTGWSISGAADGVAIGSVGTVDNYGDITASGTASTGVKIGSVGVITNGAGTSSTWLITGATGISVGTEGTVTNDGTILGTIGAGVFTGNGGSVGNGSTAQTGRSIQGVTFGVYLGHAQNGDGAVSNFGSIGASGTAGVGVDIGLSGTVINGSTGSTGWSISGAADGVAIGSVGTVDNYGDITASGTASTGVKIGSVGVITNGAGTSSTWLITGATGISVGTEGTVTNDGTILGTIGAGVFTGNGGSVGNGSTAQTGRSIQGVTFGVYLGHAQNGDGAVSNFGSIGASGTAGVGVDIGGSGTVINGAGTLTTG